MRRLVIFGAGGFGQEVLTAARERRNVIFADDRSDLPEILSRDGIGSSDEIVIAIADVTARRNIARAFKRFGQVVAPTCIIGCDVEIGDGAIFCDNTMVTARARIGGHFQCNIYSYVAHDCQIGDFVTFAPAVRCNGNVTIGDGAYIGTSAVIRQGLTIGANAIIGMGAVVTKDVPAGETWVGNPARPIAERPQLKIAGGA